MKTVATLVLTLLLGVMGTSLFGVTAHMDMSHCPFMSHEEVLCPMSLVDHVAAWKSAFLAVAPTIVFLLSLVGGTVLIIACAPNLLVSRYIPIPIYRWVLRERVYNFSYRRWQELFARGILNPKVF